MLTERKTRDAEAVNSKPIFLWDHRVRGLGVKITPAGTGSYVLNYRVGGRERRAALARCPEIGLRDARGRAGRELTAIRNGETDPPERRRQAREAPTVSKATSTARTTAGPGASSTPAPMPARSARNGLRGRDRGASRAFTLCRERSSRRSVTARRLGRVVGNVRTDGRRLPSMTALRCARDCSHPIAA